MPCISTSTINATPHSTKPMQPLKMSMSLTIPQKLMLLVMHSQFITSNLLTNMITTPPTLYMINLLSTIPMFANVSDTNLGPNISDVLHADTRPTTLMNFSAVLMSRLYLFVAILPLAFMVDTEDWVWTVFGSFKHTIRPWCRAVMVMTVASEEEIHVGFVRAVAGWAHRLRLVRRRHC